MSEPKVSEETLEFALAVMDSHYQNAKAIGDHYDDRWDVDEMAEMITELEDFKDIHT